VAFTVTVNATAATIYYIHPDHLGTPRAITTSDTTNTKVWEWSNSDPFGANLPNEDPANTGTAFKYNLRFPGQYFDSETNTNYNYYRDYDPSTGRYVQSDPIGLRGGINTFGYVGGSPLSSMDPLGLFTSSEHNKITTDAISKAGSSCKSLPGDVALVDTLEGTQDPANSFWHAMRDGSNGSKQTPEMAKSKFDNYVDQSWKSCDCAGLARALHAIQDSFAAGHRGFQPWDGGSTSLHLPTAAHAYHDGYPTKQEYNDAVNASVEQIKKYNKNCKYSCPN